MFHQNCFISNQYFQKPWYLSFLLFFFVISEELRSVKESREQKERSDSHGIFLSITFFFNLAIRLGRVDISRTNGAVSCFLRIYSSVRAPCRFDDGNVEVTDRALYDAEFLHSVNYYRWNGIYYNIDPWLENAGVAPIDQWSDRWLVTLRIISSRFDFSIITKMRFSRFFDCPNDILQICRYMVQRALLGYVHHFHTDLCNIVKYLRQRYLNFT